MHFVQSKFEKETWVAKTLEEENEKENDECNVQSSEKEGDIKRISPIFRVSVIKSSS